MTEVDWASIFNPIHLGVKADTRRGSRAFLNWDAYTGQPMSPKLEDLSDDIYRIYLDKLPTTPEGAKLYLLQSFTELSKSLYEDGQALAGEYMKYNFNFEEGHPKVLAKLDMLQLLTKSLNLKSDSPLPSRAVRLISGGWGPVSILHSIWLVEFYRLMFSWYPVLAKEVTGLPEGMKFWE